MVQWLLELKNDIKFADPEYLKLFTLAYLLLVVWVISFVLRHINRAKRTIGSRHSLISRMLRFCLVVVIAVLPLSIVASARPYLSRGAINLNRGAVETIFVVDDSISMWSKDTAPSRLGVAVREIAQIHSREVLKRGDKAALVLFGKTSSKKLRLSTDLDRFFNEISKIGQPETLTGDDHSFASDIPLALEDVYNFLDSQDRRAAYRVQYGKNPPLDFDWKKFNWRPPQRSNRIVLFFGDGDYRFNEFNSEKKERLNKALSEFHRRGLKIYSVGIATRQGVRLVDVLRDYKKGQDYNDVDESDLKEQGVTRLDTATLNLLSSQTGGSVTTVENSSGSAERILRTVIDSNRDPSAEITSEQEKQELWREFLYTALLVLGLAVLFY